MQNKEFIVAITEILAWPLVVLILCFTHGSAIRAMLRRVSRIRHNDTEFEFEAEMSALETRMASSSSKSELQHESLGGDDPFRSLVNLSPTATIVDSWNILERAVLEKAVTYVERVPGKKYQLRFDDAISDLNAKGGIDTLTFSAINEMRKLRYSVLDKTKPPADAEAAQRYVELCRRMLYRIKTFPATVTIK